MPKKHVVCNGPKKTKKSFLIVANWFFCASTIFQVLDVHHSGCPSLCHGIRRRRRWRAIKKFKLFGSLHTTRVFASIFSGFCVFALFFIAYLGFKMMRKQENVTIWSKFGITLCCWHFLSIFVESRYCALICFYSILVHATI